MCANILGVEGYVMGRTSVWPLTDEEKRSEVKKEQLKEFKEKLKNKIRNSDTFEGTQEYPDPDPSETHHCVLAEETQYWDKYESYDGEEFVIPEAD